MAAKLQNVVEISKCFLAKVAGISIFETPKVAEISKCFLAKMAEISIFRGDWDVGRAEHGDVEARTPPFQTLCFTDYQRALPFSSVRETF